MSKKLKKRKRDRNFVAIPFSFSLALSTLGNDTVIKSQALGSNFGEDIFLVSLDWMATLNNFNAGNSPVTIGLAHSDLSITEIAEFLDAELTDPDDIIFKERTKRPVRRLGIFVNEAGGTEVVLNHGNIKRTKIMFSVGDGHNIDFWARNQSGGALTSGAQYNVFGTLFGRWQR